MIGIFDEQRESRRFGARLPVLKFGKGREDLEVQVRREAAQHGDEHDADDDLVRAIAQREEREHQSDEPTDRPRPRSAA